MQEQRHAAANMIQTAWDLRQARLRDAIFISYAFRAIFKQPALALAGAVEMQRITRGGLTRFKMRRRLVATRVLQRSLLSYRARRYVRTRISSASRLQGLYWGNLVRRRLLYQTKCALKIQRMAVRWLTRRGGSGDSYSTIHHHHPRRPQLEYWIFEAMPSPSGYVVVMPILRDIMTTAIAVGKEHVTGTCRELVVGRGPRHYGQEVLQRSLEVGHRESLFDSIWPYHAWLLQRRDESAVKIQALQRGKMGRRRAWHIRCHMPHATCHMLHATCHRLCLDYLP